jgi:hypothetical protein
MAEMISGDDYPDGSTAALIEKLGNKKHKWIQVYFYAGKLRAYSIIRAKFPPAWGLEVLDITPVGHIAINCSIANDFNRLKSGRISKSSVIQPRLDLRSSTSNCSTALLSLLYNPKVVNQRKYLRAGEDVQLSQR